MPARTRSSGERGPGSLPTFFALTFLVTWSAFALAATFAPRGTPASPGSAVARELIFHVGVFAPSLVALALALRAGGRDRTRAWLGRIFHWRASAGWYLFAVLFMPVVKLTAALLHRAATGAWPRFGGVPWYLILPAILISMWVQAGEEIGWRGFALPRMAERVGLGWASILVGAIWAAWHLPLFYLFPDADTGGQSFPIYLLQVTALSVAMAWLYWRTAGSLLLVMLMHAAVNNTHDIVPSTVPGATNPLALSTSLVAWLTAALLWIAAAFLLVRMRGVRSPYETRPAS